MQLNESLQTKIGHIGNIPANSNKNIKIPYNSSGLIVFSGTKTSMFAIFHYTAYSDGISCKTVTEQGTDISYTGISGGLKVTNLATANALPVNAIVFYGNAPYFLS